MWGEQSFQIEEHVHEYKIRKMMVDTRLFSATKASIFCWFSSSGRSRSESSNLPTVKDIKEFVITIKGSKLILMVGMSLSSSPLLSDARSPQS